MEWFCDDPNHFFCYKIKPVPNFKWTGWKFTPTMPKLVMNTFFVDLIKYQFCFQSFPLIRHPHSSRDRWKRTCVEFIVLCVIRIKSEDRIYEFSVLVWWKWIYWSDLFCRNEILYIYNSNMDYSIFEWCISRWRNISEIFENNIAKIEKLLNLFVDLVIIFRLLLQSLKIRD